MKRIKYVSRFSRELSREDIQKIIASAASHNAEVGITGILMTAGHLFFQIIEGPTAAIDQLYDRILADDRHRDVLLLNSEANVPHRIFPEWSMRQFSLEEGDHVRFAPLRAILETICESRRRLESLTEVLERSIWTELMSLE